MSIDLYKRIYESQREGSPEWEGYGHSNHGSLWTRWLARQSLEVIRAPVLDVGCGHNELVNNLRASGIEAVGIDPADPQGCDLALDLETYIETNVEKIAAPRVRIVTAFDVLEHLHEHEVLPFLKAAHSLGPLAATISLRASINEVEGENLHPTVKPIGWWIDQFMSVWGLRVNHLRLTQTPSGEALALFVAAGFPKGTDLTPSVRVVVSPLMDGAAISSLGDLHIGPGVEMNVVRSFTYGIPHYCDLTIVDEVPDSDPTRYRMAQNEAMLARSDAITVTEVSEICKSNKAQSLLRIKGHGTSRRVPNWREYEGQTVVIFGAGPSLTSPGAAAEVAKMHLATVLATDRVAPALPPCDWVTLEPHPVKLEGGNRHRCVAHLDASARRVPDSADTIYLRTRLDDGDEVPGWIPEVPPARHVTSLAIWYARLCRAKNVVLIGCDYCFDDKGRAYAEGAGSQDRRRNTTEVECVDGKTRLTRGDWRANMAEIETVADVLAGVGMRFVQVGKTVAKLHGFMHTDTLASALLQLEELDG